MLKLFFKFYLVIALPLLFLFIPAVNPAYKLISSWAEDNYAKDYGGLFYLLDRELQDVAEDKKKEHIEQLNRHFGYQVALIPSTDMTLSQEKRDRIKNGEIVFQIGKTAKLYKKVLGSESVYSLNLDTNQDDDAHNAVKGPIYLLNRLLAGTPAENWPERLHDLAMHSEIPVQIIQKSLAPASVTGNVRLLDGKSVHHEQEKHLITIYATSPDPDLLYQFGPVDERDFLRRVEIVNRVLPASLLALGILLLAWPMYRDIRRLRKTALSLGEGRFDSRIRLGRGASLSPLATAFNTMAGRIQKLISSHKDLTNAVSHELKTPLTRLRFSHEMLLEHPSEKDQTRYLENIERDIDELEKMISELLEHARYDRKSKPGQFEKVNLNEWLTEIIQPFQDCFPKISLKFHSKSKTPCLFSIEKRAMARAIENIISNAVLHALANVAITLKCTDKEITIKVKDDGPGIARPDRQRIFEPFVRLDASRDRKTGSSGLGLAITKQVVKMHDGSIKCEASRLGGACFTICLQTANQQINNFKDSRS